MSATPIRRWEDAEAFALSLPGTERGTIYRMPAVKIAANGRRFVWTSHEAETSFAATIDLGTAEMLKETEPETYWQSPYYEGYPAVVRYDSPDPERVRRVIEHAYEQAVALPPTRERKRKT